MAAAGGDAALLRTFFKDVTDAQREAEVERVLNAFSLNPFEFLGMRYDADEEAVRKHFRKLSLWVHPDKNRHAQAREAFDALKAAVEWLKDGERRKDLDWKLGQAREATVKAFRKSYKKDEEVRAKWKAMGAETRDAATALFEGSDEFHECWRSEARNLMTEMEWHKRKLDKRLKEEETRVLEQEKDERESLKRHRDKHKAWNKGTDERVSSWRDFAGGSGVSKGGVSKKKKKGAGGLFMSKGGLKPPKTGPEARGADGLKNTSAVNATFR
uniref:J domain-containing protein n=1 Tax=Prasinoderma singulare TaxID=676789 RepID=A0A7S3BVQ3_9VIRI|mmetsp:Transcript_4298/g.13389  ORF Transcript_4298/g.13389 Transcript_4298/m.13389 type:complete len:271 (+) Transcript_4298:271-1083(+)